MRIESVALHNDSLSYRMLHGEKLVCLLECMRHDEKLNIMTLFTTYAWRRRGLASILLQRVIDEHKSQVWLWCHEQNQKAQDLYRKFNFIPTDEIDEDNCRVWVREQ